MSCEACGGDGLIEVGAYRGDENDTTTRECRLCGGVVSEIVKTVNAVASLSQFGVSSAQAAERLQRLTHRSSESGRRIVDLLIESCAKTPQEVAAEYAARLNAENQRRQQEAESSTTSSDMNSLIRRL